MKNLFQLFTNKESIVKIFIFLILVYPPVFLHLDILPIRIWDESRTAVTSFEVSKSGNFLVPTYQWSPEMWSTKPPLLVWLQVLAIKIIGINELALRLPVAIITFLTLIFIIWFSIKYFKDFYFGFISVLVLITCHGYVNIHATRTGDYDAPLSSFMFLYALCFFLFIETDKRKYLLLTFLGLMLAVMTKSTAGLLFLPALFIYSLIRKKFLTIFKMKEFYLGLLIFFVPILTYYIGREIYNPGYINTVIENEYGQRYLTTIENHKGDFWFYWQNFLAFQITKWYWLIPCGIVVGVSSKNELVKKLSLFITIVSVSFFLLISFSQTKCEWYDVPIYPFLAMIIGMFLYLVFDFLKNLEKIKTLFKWNIIPFVFLFIVMIDPYRTIINKVYFPKEYFWDEEFYQISYFLQDATKGERAIDNSLLCYDGYNAHLLFYLDVLNDKGHKIDFADWHKLHVNEKAIAYQGDVKKYIEENYSFEIIRDDKSIRTYKITGIKKMS